MPTERRSSILWRCPAAPACIKGIGMFHKLEDPSILADGVEIINQYPLIGIAIAACRWSCRHDQKFQGDGATTALIKNIGAGIAIWMKAKLNPEKRIHSDGSQAADIVLVSRNGRVRTIKNSRKAKNRLIDSTMAVGRSISRVRRVWRRADGQLSTVHHA